jgi:2-polyprenyl-6-methoxyphenol hydroxylase-like FAD-dependent oxidoreductase
MRVAVAGAGVGGLCLAQGLRRAGLEVRVVERGAPRRTGYRLHLDARAGIALAGCLPPELFDLVLATASRPTRKFTLLSSRLRVRREISGDPAADPDRPETLSTSVDRGTLLAILATGLDIRFGHEVVGFEAGPDDVTVRFADGGTFRADVLVGADGVHSAVRRRLLPAAEVVDTGTRVIYGRSPLEAVRPVLPPALADGFVAIVSGHVGLASGVVEFRRPPAEAGLPPVGDYVMWGLSAAERRLPDLGGRSPAELHAAACRAVRRWHPDVRELVGRAAVEETFLVRVRSSVRVPPWPPGRVTLLGDAIHAMSPARGSGANTALQDAGKLAAALAGDGVAAIGAYEQEMRDYGFAAVEASRAPVWRTSRPRSRRSRWFRPRRSA